MGGIYGAKVPILWEKQVKCPEILPQILFWAFWAKFGAYFGRAGKAVNSKLPLCFCRKFIVNFYVIMTVGKL